MNTGIIGCDVLIQELTPKLLKLTELEKSLHIQYTRWLKKISNQIFVEFDAMTMDEIFAHLKKHRNGYWEKNEMVKTQEYNKYCNNWFRNWPIINIFIKRPVIEYEVPRDVMVTLVQKEHQSADKLREKLKTQKYNKIYPVLFATIFDPVIRHMFIELCKKYKDADILTMAQQHVRELSSFIKTISSVKYDTITISPTTMKMICVVNNFINKYSQVDK